MLQLELHRFEPATDFINHDPMHMAICIKNRHVMVAIATMKCTYEIVLSNRNCEPLVLHFNYSVICYFLCQKTTCNICMGTTSVHVRFLCEKWLHKKSKEKILE